MFMSFSCKSIFQGASAALKLPQGVLADRREFLLFTFALLRKGFKAFSTLPNSGSYPFPIFLPLAFSAIPDSDQSQGESSQGDTQQDGIKPAEPVHPAL
jgi:hypothetical protein